MKSRSALIMLEEERKQNWTKNKQGLLKHIVYFFNIFRGTLNKDRFHQYTWWVTQYTGMHETAVHDIAKLQNYQEVQKVLNQKERDKNGFLWMNFSLHDKNILKKWILSSFKYWKNHWRFMGNIFQMHKWYDAIYHAETQTEN